MVSYLFGENSIREFLFYIPALQGLCSTMRFLLLLSASIFLSVRVYADPPIRKHSNVERLKLDRLKAVHESVAAINQKRRAVPLIKGYNDYKCIFHAHAEDSAHTGGTLPEMLQEARKAGIHAIFLSDHFRPPRDFIDGRWRGMKEGVLFVPGSEARGFLLYPSKSILPRMDVKTPELVETVINTDDGLIFLSHIEERPEHSMVGLTGLEIYNRHWDAKRDMASLLNVALKLTDPKSLEELQKALELYPDELFAFQCDYPDVYLKKWDAESTSRRLTGVAANDCHHNQIMLVKMLDEKNVLLGTNVDQDKDMRKISVELRPGLKTMIVGKKPGDIVARIDLDPYHRSFKNSATHVLAASLDEVTLRKALKAGHAFVSHDWMCDASGFQFVVKNDKSNFLAMMGDEITYQPNLHLEVQLPVQALIRIIRNGKELQSLDSRDHALISIDKPGVYRIEAWLNLDGEYRPWIYSNPVYVK